MNCCCGVTSRKRMTCEPSQTFEKLVPHQDNYFSRRLNHQHRVVYKVKHDEKIVEIYSAWSHYE